MNSNYQWIENTYEPGLFTFYLQEESLCPPSRKGERENEKGAFNNRRFHSQLKMAAKERSTYRFNKLKVTLSPQDSKMVVLDSKQTSIFHKMANKPINSQRFPSESIENRQADYNKGFNPNQTVKNANIIQYFHYDINKNRSKMFIYKGETPVFVKKYSKRYQKNPEGGDNPMSVTSRNRWEFQTARVSTQNANKSINSDGRVIAQAKKKLNYLQFMIQRNKRQQLMKSQSNKKDKIEKTLAKLKQVRRPEILEIPMRMVTDF